MEIVFSVTQEGDGGFVAECLSHDIFTEGDTWDQLRANVREAVPAYFFDQPEPSGIPMHLVRDEVLAPARSCWATWTAPPWPSCCASTMAIAR